MRKFGLLVMVLALVCTVNAEAASRNRKNKKGTPVTKASLAKACPKILLVGGQSSTIYKNSAPLRSGGVGTPLVGFRKEPTLIMNKKYSTGGTTIYDSNGNKIGSCPWASAHGHGGGRYRCTMSTPSLRGNATRNTKKANVYFKVNGNTCVNVPDAGRCYGSVKGLCNQLIK